MNMSIFKSVAGASVILTLFGIISKGIGFIREIIYANKFGLSIDFDLFLISFTIPNIINSATIYLCQHYFIPSFNKESKVSLVSGTEFFRQTFWLFSIVGLSIAIILFFISEDIIGLFLTIHSDESRIFANKMFKIFLITIPINSGMSVIMAYQQAKFNFVTPAVSLAMLNIIVIAGVLLLTEYLNIYVLPLSFAIAYAISFIFLFSKVRKVITIFPLKSIFVIGEKERFKIIVSLIFIEGLSLSYVLIDRLFISDVTYGGISTLNYAFVIFSLPVSLFSIPLITTLFSKFSTTPDSMNIDTRNAYGMILYIMLPISFIYYNWGDLILITFYEGGKFTSSNTYETFTILKYYSFGLIFLSIYHLFVKIFYSAKKYNYVLIISVFAIVVKIVFSALLVNKYKQEGLALSTTLLYIFLMSFASIFLLTKLKVIRFFNLVQKLILIFLNLLIAYLISQFLIEFVELDYLGSKIISLMIFIFAFYITSYNLNDSELNLIKLTIFRFFNQHTELQ